MNQSIKANSFLRHNFCNNAFSDTDTHIEQNRKKKSFHDNRKKCELKFFVYSVHFCALWNKNIMEDCERILYGKRYFPRQF